MTIHTLGQEAYAEVDLIVSQGATNRFSFRYKTGELVPTPVNLIGWLARAQFRRSVSARTAWATFDDDDITLTSDGLVTLLIPYSVTETDAWDSRDEGVWDLELTSPAGERIRLVQGKLEVSHAVTRDG